MTALTVQRGTAAALLSAQSEQVGQFVRNRHAVSTRRACGADVLAFHAWCAEQGVAPLPAAPEAVAAFPAASATSGLRPATISRRLAAVRYLHREGGRESATGAEVVEGTVAGIRRTTGAAKRPAAPATAVRVAAMLGTCGDDLQGLRDRALLALGFGGASRRSELAALRVEDLEQTEVGTRVRLARPKTDQDGAGAVVPVLDGPRLRIRDALTAWLGAAGVTSGSIFRTLGKGGRMLDRTLGDRSIADIVKRRAADAGFDPAQFSGHSLRTGFVTSAAAAGGNIFKMMTVSRHRSMETVRGYVQMAEQFKDHAGASFM